MTVDVSIVPGDLCCHWGPPERRMSHHWSQVKISGQLGLSLLFRRSFSRGEASASASVLSVHIMSVWVVMDFMEIFLKGREWVILLTYLRS